MNEPFEWNHEEFGGTEYMARNFREKILPHTPKLRDYLSIVVPGIVPHENNLYNSTKQIIMWIHNTPSQYTEEALAILRNPKFLDKIKYFVAVSESGKQEIINQLNIDPNLVYVIPNAINPLRYDLNKFNKPDKIKLITVSSPDRGLAILLNSLPLVKEDFELDVFGSFNPDKFPELTPDPRINFYGFSAKATVAKHYEAAHIHAYPSTYVETFCLSQAEAMSAGLLCVTSDMGALPEVSNGHTIIYPYEPDNVKHQEIFAEHLTKAICDIKSGNWNPDKQIEYVNKTYSWDAIKDKWLEFHELI
jgi:glycosyltransferase involved in cell wall biosynthesis